MKKFLMFVASLFTAMTINGCGGDDGYYGDDLITLYLVDEYGYSYGNVPYLCDSMTRWGATQNNGEFSFYSGENCTFDFYGFNGNYGDSTSDIVRIVDYYDNGKGGIGYTCNSFGVGNTYYPDGSFDYNANDECEFYL